MQWSIDNCIGLGIDERSRRDMLVRSEVDFLWTSCKQESGQPTSHWQVCTYSDNVAAP